jgi:Na+/melibiose symporter-like transporter
MVMNAFAGPPVGGFLLAIAFSLPFFVDAGTFAVAAAMVALLVGKFRPQVESRSTFTGDLKEGFRWLWRHRLLRRFAIALGVLNASFSAAGATIVLFAQEVLRLDAAQFGLLASAGALGGVAGSFLAPKLSAWLGSGANLLLSLGTGALGNAVIGFTSSALVVWAMYAVISVGVVLWNVVTVSLRQAIIPDRLLGRVNSVYRFFGWGMMPIGIFAGGLTVSLVANQFGREIGLRAPMFLASAVMLGMIAYSVSRFSTAAIDQARQEAGLA